MDKRIDVFIETSRLWPLEMAELRKIILSTKLNEQLKWNLPCFSYEKHNIVIIQPFKKCLALMFFKGALLKDTQNLLVSNGPNSHFAKRLEFLSIGDVKKSSASIKRYIKEAIALGSSGETTKPKKKPEQMPEELTTALAKNAKLKSAFLSLTPGRQRAYILYFSSAKQSATRRTRIEKYIPRILAKKGLADRE
ncbi:MAG: hypothetical protein RJB66_15 [Pseudomonadota bacterium]|jgi:uncharacterized protein YdeI (YjbR/CyaY-like superfamily)